MILFAGRELAGSLSYLKNQGKEINVSINYPKFLEPFVKFYISIFGIPEIGLQERFHFFEDCIKQIEGAVFVDAGCGSGVYARYMALSFPKSKIYAFDIENELILLNRTITREKNILFAKHDLTKPLTRLKNKVDVLYCIDVLEHIKDYKKAVKNFTLMLKKNGYLLIHVPLPHQRRWFNFFKTWEHETHVHEGIDEKELIGLLSNYRVIVKRKTFGAIGSLTWEINTLLFKYIPPLGALLFPFLRFILLFDKFFPSRRYNCIGVFAQKT